MEAAIPKHLSDTENILLKVNLVIKGKINHKKLTSINQQLWGYIWVSRTETVERTPAWTQKLY